MSKRLKENKHSYEEKLKKNNMRLIIFIIFAIIFIFSIVNLSRWAIYNKKSANLIKDIVNENFQDTLEKEEENKNPVNFGELCKINKDIIAWIRIKNTKINYPIVQTDNNYYYLKKDINKKYSTCGWIFMNYKNSNNFSDRNTVLYGHNIKSGLMFSDLQKIYKNELGTDGVIEIYTEKEKLEYKVFSSYLTEPEEYSTKPILDEDSEKEYLQEILKRSSIMYNIVPDKSDKLITLSTCDNSGKNRILVHGFYIGGEKY